MTQVAAFAASGPSLQWQPPLAAPPRDNAATATQVANLLRQGRQGEAVAVLTQAKQGQPQTLQDALDRMVSSQLRACVQPSTTPAPGAFASAMPFLQDLHTSPLEVGNAIRQIDQAAGRPAMPDTANLSTAQKYDVYSSIVHTRGNQAASDALARGDKVILGLRHEDGSTLLNHGQGNYDDRVVVLSKDANGIARVEEFNHSSTEPTAQYDANQRSAEGVIFRRGEGEDVTGDGVLELGRVGEGTMEMGKADHKNPKSAGGTIFSLRPTPQAVAAGANRIERDSSHDGTFDANDVRSNLNDSFKIHAGSLRNTDSAGCTTIFPKNYTRFESAVRENPGQDRWQYVLTATAR